MHFERMASDYAASRPPYPEILFETLKDRGVIGPRLRVLEVGAGAGLATRALVSSSSEVVAVEPGRDLAAILRKDIPDASVVVARLEDAALSARSFDPGGGSDLLALGGSEDRTAQTACRPAPAWLARRLAHDLRR